MAKADVFSAAEGVRELVRRRRLAERTRPGEQLDVPPYWRPKTRADCVDGPRPCPFVGCRHHLATEVLASGGLRIMGGGEPEALKRMPETCSLDVAERDGLTLESVCNLLQLTRERVRQQQVKALDQLRRILSDWDRIGPPFLRRALPSAAAPGTSAPTPTTSEEDANVGGSELLH